MGRRPGEKSQQPTWKVTIDRQLSNLYSELPFHCRAARNRFPRIWRELMNRLPKGGVLPAVFTHGNYLVAVWFTHRQAANI